jgi:hypothetical protein
MKRGMAESSQPLEARIMIRAIVAPRRMTSKSRKPQRLIKDTQKMLIKITVPEAR